MFNNLTCLLVKGLAETLKCLNVFIIFVGIIGVEYTGKYTFKLIAISGLILYILTTASIKFVVKNSKIKNIKFFLTIIINISISIFIIKDISFQYMPYCILYFLAIIAYAVTHYSNKLNDTNGFLKKYFYGIMWLLILIYLMQGFKEFEVIKIYVPLYLIISILYIVQVNILEEYSDGDANLINEDKNIRRFNIVSIVTSILSIFIFTTDLFKKVYEFGEYVVEKFIFILVKPISVVMFWLFGGFGDGSKAAVESFYAAKAKEEIENQKEVLKEFDKEFLKIKESYQNETALLIAKIIVITIFVFIICLVIYLMYKKLMKIQSKSVELVDVYGEERSFVFRKDESEKRKGKIRRENLRDLHVIRRIYIDVIKTLKTRGIEYKSAYTPNEYSLFIENTEFKSKNIGELANIYNHLRYGNKAISKDDINKAYKIKENL